MSAELHVNTPLWHSLPISRLAGKPVYLKMEALQPVGSFKIRGIGLLCQKALAAGAKQFVSSSGGNAGVAAAYAGRELGIKTTVYVFAGVPETAKLRMQEFGAEVVMAGPSWAEAHAMASELAEKQGAFYVHPFDHPDLWAGHSTLVDEVVASGYRPNLVIASVGGGGLLTGILDGLDRHSLRTTKVIAVETYGTDSLHQSLQAGQQITLPRINSVAKTLGAARVCDAVFERAVRHKVESLVVTDEQALKACRQFALDHRVLVEPAAGAALSVAYEQLGSVPQASDVLVVVCGGVGIALRDDIFAYAPRLPD
jgi:L-serine/L-threonine ammonia-lyase